MRLSFVLEIGVLSFASTCLAQEWEAGGAFAFGIYRNATITNPAGSAGAGFDDRFGLGGVLSQNLYEHFTGELPYTFRDGDLKLWQGSQKVNMDGDADAIHYDMLFSPLSRESRIRPFAAAGAGIKYFRATGKEYVSQPFADFAKLTKTNQVEPLISVGGGVRYALSRNLAARLEFRDYITPFPKKLFVTAGGAKIHGWLNDLVPMLGVSYVF